MAGDRCVLRVRRDGCDRRCVAPGNRSCASADGERIQSRRRDQSANCARTEPGRGAIAARRARAVAAADRRLAVARIRRDRSVDHRRRDRDAVDRPLSAASRAFAAGVPYQIAIAQIAGTARYATLSVSAILVSFSLMVSMAIMVTSFRTSLDQWTQRMLPADMYVRLGYVGQSAHLDARTCSARPVARCRALRDGSLRPCATRCGPQPLTLIARSADHMPIARRAAG